MKDLFTRGLALLLTAAVFAILLPVALQVLFTVGPIGFIVLIFVIFAVGSVLSK